VGADGKQGDVSVNGVEQQAGFAQEAQQEEGNGPQPLQPEQQASPPSKTRRARGQQLPLAYKQLE
ncbi:unnamed protein product, partial [Amoebophrya sp. A25]